MARGMWIGVSGVARKIKNYWIGVDSAGYRLLYNVPMYDKINIGGDIFTVIGHDVATKYTALSGKGSLLWHDEPEVTSPVSWTEKGATSAINNTITSMAKSTSSAKFKILNYQCFKYHLSQEGSVRYYNGTAVSHWAAGARTGYEYVQARYDSSGNYIDGDYYNWFSTSFHWVESDGSGGGYSDDSTIADHMSSPPNGIEGSIPSSIKHYYYYACEVDGNTKVTYNSNTGYWELFSE